MMDALERELRGGEVDPSLMAELGWSLPQARQFVEAYKRTKIGGQRQSEKTDLPQKVQTGSAARANNQVMRNGQVDPSARALQATHQRAPDQTRELMEVGRQRITPRYRPVLEAYYRSISSRPAP